MIQFLYNFRKNLRDTRGVSLLIVFGLMVILILAAGTVTKLVLGFMQTTVQVEQANKAYFAAEGGVEMALYDLADYKDGYQTDDSKSVCDVGVDLDIDEHFTANCNEMTGQYRFVDFVDAAADSEDDDLSGARGFWRLFSRTLESSGNQYLIPNPYFVGDKDDELTSSEWGELNKSQPISLSLLMDTDPGETDPQDRFTWISDFEDKVIIFDPGVNWDSNFNGDIEDELFTWTLSGIDGDGGEHTLQGVAWETDFVNQDCDDSGTVEASELCFIFDLNDAGAHIPGAFGGDVYAGEDINRNLSGSLLSGSSSVNRVSSVQEAYLYATPQEYLEELDDAMTGPVAQQWRSARLTISLIATLSESSGTDSNSLRYKFVSDEPWSDEYTYIISQGFAGQVKQAIETRFKRESVIPIFSYVIFQ